MVRTLLGIIASPRKYGNSELFVKEVFRQMPEGWSLQMLRLQEFDIRPCKACYQCLFKEMVCPQKDDFSTVLQAMAEADAWVVAAPTYFLGANSALKRLLDRGLSFYGRMDALMKKPAVGVAIAGIKGMEGYTKLVVESFIKLSMADLRGSDVIYGALPGEIFLNGEAKSVAGRFAAALTSPVQAEPTRKSVATAPICPLCGSDTFRFLDDHRLKCMLCSSEGTYRWQDGRMQVETMPGDHPLFLKDGDARRHLEWLRGMKEQFLEKRNELKEVVRQYAHQGNWLRPVKE